MIISHRHRFIFLHCRKSAGSAVKVSLARTLGPRDFQLGVWGDTLRTGIKPNLRARLHLLNPRDYAYMLRARRAGDDPGGILNQVIKRAWKRRTGLGNFPPARDVQRLFPREWAEYHKFCIVRNPYDRLVSDYFYRTKKYTEPPSFAEFIEAMAEGRDLDGRVKVEYSNWEMYTIDDRIAVDSVIRFEELDEELRRVLDTIGVPWDGWLPRTKAGEKRPKAYRDLYQPRQIEQVRQLCRREIEAFGHEF